MSISSNSNVSAPATEATSFQARTESRVSAYVELTKMRISVMVLVTFIVAAAIAASGLPNLSVLLFGTLGMLFVAASGNAMNMYLERYSDFLMPRTAGRPLPAQKLSAFEVAIFGTVALSVGLTILLLLVNWQTAACGLGNWILYVCIYTPMKRKTWANTEVGAIAGAMPIVMGALATTAMVPRIAWVFFAVLFFWQFPHFMAIAWKYRDQYRAGGLQMLTVVDPTGKRAGRKAVVTGVLLLLVSILPVLDVRTTTHAIVFALAAIALGLFYLKPAVAFNSSPNDQTAKRLLRVSLLYLPLYMVALIVACLT